MLEEITTTLAQLRTGGYHRVKPEVYTSHLECLLRALDLAVEQGPMNTRVDAGRRRKKTVAEYVARAEAGE